jgi:UTP--glucose-1-phosphate uridylyltransferase
LINQYEETQSSVIGVQIVEDNQTHRYGIVDPKIIEGRRYQVSNFIEKPAPGTAPSNLAIMGRYVLTPEIFDFLEKQETGAGGEIQLTDAIQALNKLQNVYAFDFEGMRYDVGEKMGFVKTTIEFALNNDELGDEIFSFMEKLLEENSLRKVEV